MIDAVKVTGKEIPRHLRGSYTGRKFKVRAATTVEIPADAGVWGGGTRYSYSAIRLEDGATITLGSTAAPWNPERREKEVTLSPGIAVVLHTYFCGTDMGLTFYVHPDNLPKFIKNG